MNREKSDLFIAISRVSAATKTATPETAAALIKKVNGLLKKVASISGDTPLALKRDTELLLGKRKELQQILEGGGKSPEKCASLPTGFLNLSSIAESLYRNHESLSTSARVDNTKEFARIIAGITDADLEKWPLIPQGRLAFKDLQISFKQMIDHSRDAWLRQSTFICYQWTLVISKEEGKEHFVPRDDLCHLQNRAIHIAKF